MQSHSSVSVGVLLLLPPVFTPHAYPSHPHPPPCSTPAFNLRVYPSHPRPRPPLCSTPATAPVWRCRQLIDSDTEAYINHMQIRRQFAKASEQALAEKGEYATQVRQ